MFLAAVYIPARANSSTALGLLHEVVSAQETAHPDAVFIIAGDFKHCNLRTVPPKYYQYVNFPTRDQSTLDHVYSDIRDAYKAVPRPHFGLFDHISLFLFPANRQRLKQTTPLSKQVKLWSQILRALCRTVLHTQTGMCLKIQPPKRILL